MPEAFSVLNALSPAAAEAALTRCCSARRWVQAMLAARPYASSADLFRHADEAWANLGRADYLEAFAQHPQIGDDLAALREKFAAEAWSRGEQAGVEGASEETLSRLRTQNLAYFERFGHIFIVCATGKSAAEMLTLLTQRLLNAPDEELRIAAAEQAAITRLRLEKLAT